MNISIGKPDDIFDIMTFIDSNWKNDHILARNKSFFKYEYLYNNQINFIVARENNDIVGLLGFIPSSISNKNNGTYSINNKSDYCATLWKVRKNLKNPTVGIQLLEHLRKMNNMGTLLSLGLNEETIDIYRFLGIYTDTLKQYFIINHSIRDYKIAQLNDLLPKDKKPLLRKTKHKVKLLKDHSDLNDFEFHKYEQNIPSKNKEYLVKRYFCHPIYKYAVYGYYETGRLSGIFITRIQAHNNANVLRIVDFIGEQNSLYNLGLFISELIADKEYEYADFYCFGLKSTILEKAGFQQLDYQSDDIIIPNYFNPFVQKNIPIRFYSDTEQIDSLRLFKADGDQDRPN